MTSYLRDESKLHNANTFIILLSAFAWIILAGAIGFLIFSSYKGVSALITLIVIIFGVFADNYFNYTECVKLTFDRNKIIYEYKLNDTLVGNRGVKVNIKNIKKIKFRRNKAIIYGDITKKQPFIKEKELKKIDVPTNFGKDADNVIKSLKEYIGGK